MTNSGSASLRDVLDPNRLAEWLRDRGVGSGLISDIRFLSGGTQNILVRFTVDGTPLVLRRPSLHAGPEAVKAIGRESRVLAALAGSKVPHPRLVGAMEQSLDVIGAPFYVMQHVDGFNVTVCMPAELSGNAGGRRELAFALVDALSELARFDHLEAGLADFGVLEGFIQRQVPRWAGQLESYLKYDSWPGTESLPGIVNVGEWLASHRPASAATGLMHGDCHIGNALFNNSANGYQIAALLDWEMAALGTPLLDLARLLVSWPDAAGHSSLSVDVDWTGFPPRDELIERYRVRSGVDVSDLPWFEVLACYKLAIILEGSYARACAGLSSLNTGERLHRSARKLLTRALDALEHRI